jgi:catechol 2,3-dioxygenase-like lactoylglutathione lyase family enzyme
MILKLHHSQITVPNGSEDEARRFYSGLLGLRELPKPEALQGRGGFWLELDDFQIHVGVEDNVDRAHSKAHLAYLVTDLEAWREKLSAAHVEIIEGIPIPGYVRFEFRDPFGNRVEFLQSI